MGSAPRTACCGQIPASPSDVGRGERPAEELFALNTDPDCLKNLAADPAFAVVKAELAAKLDAQLIATGDPRATGDGEIFETYPRFSAHRKFPEP